jgi:HAD superfamily hydrolase (TIGR01549 family)
MNTDRQRLVCLDLGDTLMIEESEEKDADGVTLAADLIPGMAELVRELHRRGVRLALVADTRIGTYRNVLRQHGLFDLFHAFAISEELGVHKPHPEMFAHALQGVGLEPAAGAVLMVGNNYARDIVGAKQAGFDTLWFHWNDRYPAPADTQAADGEVASVDELTAWVEAWLDAPLGADGDACEGAVRDVGA